MTAPAKKRRRAEAMPSRVWLPDGTTWPSPLLAIRHANTLLRERDAAKEQAAARSGCPCRLVQPCKPECSCASRVQSGGCDRCCTYGSDEQRQAKAEWIVARNARVLPVIEAARQALVLACPGCRAGWPNFDELHRQDALSPNGQTCVLPGLRAALAVFDKEPTPCPRQHGQEG